MYNIISAVYIYRYVSSNGIMFHTLVKAFFPFCLFIMDHRIVGGKVVTEG